MNINIERNKAKKIQNKLKSTIKTSQQACLVLPSAASNDSACQYTCCDNPQYELQISTHDEAIRPQCHVRSGRLQIDYSPITICTHLVTVRTSDMA